MSVSNLAIQWTERGMLPDGIVRAGIRRLLRERLVEIGADDAVSSAATAEAVAAAMGEAPNALVPVKANEQQ